MSEQFGCWKTNVDFIICEIVYVLLLINAYTALWVLTGLL